MFRQLKTNAARCTGYVRAATALVRLRIAQSDLSSRCLLTKTIKILNYIDGQQRPSPTECKQWFIWTFAVRICPEDIYPVNGKFYSEILALELFYVTLFSLGYMYSSETLENALGRDHSDLSQKLSRKKSIKYWPTFNWKGSCSIFTFYEG